MTIRRAGNPKPLRLLLTAVVATAALAMIVLHDTHGVGLVAGLALSLLLPVRRATKPGP